MSIESNENTEQVARDGFTVDPEATDAQQTDEVLERAQAAGIEGDRDWARDEAQRALATEVELPDPDDDADGERAQQ